ncbi:MAG: FecR domain-containing protein [Myxococcota bacterium]
MKLGLNVRLAPLIAFLAVACDCGNAPLATLERASGDVERDYAASVEDWEAADSGATFRLGDGLRTSSEASARLRLVDGTNLDLEEETVIRFRLDGDEEQGQLEVVSGEIVVESEGALDIAVSMGAIRIERGSRARVRADQSLEVLVGQAIIERGGERRVVGEGNRQPLVGPTLAPLEPLEPLPNPPLAPVELDDEEDAGTDDEDAGEEDAGDEDAGEESAPTGPAAPRPVALGPATADLALANGSNLVIHAPSVPVRVAVDASACQGNAVLKAGRRRSRSEDPEVRLSLPSGSHRWELLCDDSSIASGRVRVLRDAGRRRMPRVPPRTVIDVDGRPYRVVYQNQLPEVTIRWPGAPGSGPYSLTAQRGGRSVEREATQPRFSFRSGQLRDGTHTIRVQAASGERSPATRLMIRFDNAAPTASVTAPENGAFGPGAAVEVAGTAAPGWSVRIGGQALELDDQFRFTTQAAAPAGRDSLVIRLTHPSRGTHIYLRRTS